MSFSPRLTSAGISTSNYWIANDRGGYNPFRGSVNPLSDPSIVGNCTWYAQGRSAEIAGANIVSELPNLGNAQNWFANSACSWERDGYADPSSHSGEAINVQVGDILCYTGGSYGHVEVVEVVNGDGTVTVSYSDYITPLYFATATQSVYVNAPCHLTSKERLQGVIHNPYAQRPTPPEPDMYYLSYHVEPTGAGYITGSPEGYYEDGEEVSITAHANPGYIFRIWSNGDTTETMTMHMTRDKNRIAYFDKKDNSAIISTLAYIKKKEDGTINEITIYL